MLGRPPQDLLRTCGVGVERHGIPGTAGDQFMGHRAPTTRSAAPRTSNTDEPTPVPRFSTVVSSPPSRYSSAFTSASARSRTCT